MIFSKREVMAIGTKMIQISKKTLTPKQKMLPAIAPLVNGQIGYMGSSFRYRLFKDYYTSLAIKL